MIRRVAFLHVQAAWGMGPFCRDRLTLSRVDGVSPVICFFLSDVKEGLEPRRFLVSQQYIICDCWGAKEFRSDVYPRARILP